MINPLYIEQLEACGKTIKRFKKRIEKFSSGVHAAGHGYVYGDDLTFLLNACPLTELEDMHKRIEKLEWCTGVDFPKH